MSRFQLSVVVLILLFIVFGASMVATSSMLPDRVATHFDAAGKPNDWMSRSAHVTFMSIFGVLFPAFIIGICWCTRFMPTSMINIPHREYWLAAERRQESADYLFQHSIWLGCLGLGFVTGLHWAVVFSNQRQPAELPPLWIFSIAGLFLLGTVTWVYGLYRRFRAPGHMAILLVLFVSGVSRAGDVPIVAVEGQPLAASHSPRPGPAGCGSSIHNVGVSMRPSGGNLPPVCIQFGETTTM